MQSQPQTQFESVKRLRGRLIVSVQASEGEPLCSSEHINALAQSAINGGAGALRLEGVDNIKFVGKRTDLPIIGLIKSSLVPEHERLKRVYITPTFDDAVSLAKAGADIIALDATARPRPDGSTVAQLIDRIHSELGKPVWADIATLEEGLQVGNAKVDLVSTTLSGYTAETSANHKDEPDLELLQGLCRQLTLPVVLEGKVWEPSQVTAAFKMGAYAVVVGSAITRPHLITRRFVDAIPRGE